MPGNESSASSLKRESSIIHRRVTAACPAGKQVIIGSAIIHRRVYHSLRDSQLAVVVTKR